MSYIYIYIYIYIYHFFIYIYIYLYVSPSALPGSLESTRPGRELVTTCRSSGSTPRGRKPYVVCSRRAVLLRVAVALTSRLLLCRTSGCSRSATPLPTLLRHHTTWAQACDCVFSSFSLLVGRWRRFRVVGPLRLVVPWFPVDSRPRRGGPPSTTLGGAIFRPPQRINNR